MTLPSHDLNAILDNICEQHGLTSRAEARRWLKEQRDLKVRSKTAWARVPANPQLRVINDNGEVKPLEERMPEAKPPPERVPDFRSPFDPVMLIELSSGSKPKPRNQVTISSKSVFGSLNIPTEAQRERRNELARQRYHEKKKAEGREASRPGPKLAEYPKGEKTILIVQTLFANDWDVMKTVDDLFDHPYFDLWNGNKKKRKLMQSTVRVAVTRWKDRLTGESGA